LSKAILVVDDEADMRALTRMSLEVFGGHRVMVAASGAEALVALADGTFDAVVMDVQMPDLDGPATLTALRDRGAAGDPPVVFVTGRSREEELAALRGMDVAGVLTKPFDPLTLAERVGELLGWST
jgi:CheY-like chemotaxis protein